MSSAVTITLPSTLDLDPWLSFCEGHGIEFSPATIGQNVFYRGGMGGVEIKLNEPGAADRDGSGRQTGSLPPARFSEIRVGTFFMGDLQAVAQTANLIIDVFGGTVQGDEEVMSIMRRPAQPKAAQVTIPREPGYWYCSGGKTGWHIVLVAHRLDVKSGQLDGLQVWVPGEDRSYDVSDLAGQWLAPVPAPTIGCED